MATAQQVSLRLSEQLSENAAAEMIQKLKINTASSLLATPRGCTVFGSTTVNVWYNVTLFILHLTVLYDYLILANCQSMFSTNPRRQTYDQGVISSQKIFGFMRVFKSSSALNVQDFV